MDERKLSEVLENYTPDGWMSLSTHQGKQFDLTQRIRGIEDENQRLKTLIEGTKYLDYPFGNLLYGESFEYWWNLRKGIYELIIRLRMPLTSRAGGGVRLTPKMVRESCADELEALAHYRISSKQLW